MKAEHYAANGFFINDCHGYLMKNLIAGFDRAYGLFAFKCVGGPDDALGRLRARRLRLLRRRHPAPEASPDRRRWIT